MCGIPRLRRPPGGVPPPPGPSDPRAGEMPGTGVCPVAGPLSSWRIVPGPFAAWVAALDRWQLTAPGDRLRLGRSVLRGPAGHDPQFGTCRIEVRLARRRRATGEAITSGFAKSGQTAFAEGCSFQTGNVSGPGDSPRRCEDDR